MDEDYFYLLYILSIKNCWQQAALSRIEPETSDSDPVVLVNQSKTNKMIKNAKMDQRIGKHNWI